MIIARMERRCFLVLLHGISNISSWLSSSVTDARVLKEITWALEKEGEELNLAYKTIGDAGAAALGAALLAVPAIRFTELSLYNNDLTAAGVASLAPALRRPWGDGGLKELWVRGNPLGDAGVAALAKALPQLSGLQHLGLESLLGNFKLLMEG